MSTRSLPKRSLAGVAAVTAVLTLALASCSSSSDDDSSDAASGAGDAGAADMTERQQAESFQVEGAPADADGASGSGAPSEVGSQVDVQLPGAAVIRTGSVEMQTDDVTEVVDKIYLLAHSTRGTVSSESTSTDAKGVAVQSLIEVKVPVAKFTFATGEIKKLGTAAQVDTDEKDVTAQVADVNSRVRSMEGSIESLRRLFARATKLGDIITLERELSQREADLEAMQAKQRSLQAQTTMSTLMVSVSLTDEPAPPKDDDEDQAGFIAGLEQGWDGFVTFVVGVSHAVGLILPLGLLAAALAWIGWVLTRRYRTQRVSTSVD